MPDQEFGHQIDHENLSSDDLHGSYNIDEFEIRILEPEKSGGIWQKKAIIPMIRLVGFVHKTKISKKEDIMLTTNQSKLLILSIKEIVIISLLNHGCITKPYAIHQ